MNLAETQSIRDDRYPVWLTVADDVCGIQQFSVSKAADRALLLVSQ